MSKILPVLRRDNTAVVRISRELHERLQEQSEALGYSIADLTNTGIERLLADLERQRQTADRPA